MSRFQCQLSGEGTHSKTSDVEANARQKVPLVFARSVCGTPFRAGGLVTIVPRLRLWNKQAHFANVIAIRAKAVVSPLHYGLVVNLAKGKSCKLQATLREVFVLWCKMSAEFVILNWEFTWKVEARRDLVCCSSAYTHFKSSW